MSQSDIVVLVLIVSMFALFGGIVGWVSRAHRPRRGAHRTTDRATPAHAEDGLGVFD